MSPHDTAAMEAENRRLKAELENARNAQQQIQAHLALSVQRCTLLAQGVESKWTDAALMGAFAEGDPVRGLLAAVLAMLKQEADLAHEEAENLVAQGKVVEMQGAVAAAARLRRLRQRFIALWEQSRDKPEAVQAKKPRGYGGN